MRIEMSDVSLQYGETQVLEDMQLTFTNHDFLLIEGASGTGKTSLLRLLNRLCEPISGTIYLDGKAFAEYDPLLLRRRIGYVQQVPVVIEASVRENLLLPFRFRIARAQQTPEETRLRRWLDDLQLFEVPLEEPAGTLSVGQKQRLCLIRSFLVKPQILLCDEPTSALDAVSQELVEKCLEKLHQQWQMGVVLVSHRRFRPHSTTPRRFLLQRGKLEELSCK